MKNKEARELLLKYNNGTATEGEIAWVETWYLKFDDKVSNISPDQVREDELDSWNILKQQTGPTSPLKLWKVIGVAASVTIVFGLGLIFYTPDVSDFNTKNSISYHNDVPPGQDKALLTLSNGKKVVLPGAKNGFIAREKGLIITKKKDGELIYEVASSVIGHELVYNTLETPRGGQYQVTLPDGTKVWLNAASSIRFPVSFTHHARSVNLEGEAYFEVKRDKNKPFIVHSSKQKVEVLGTHFNINSYQEEHQTRTTLLEGSVRVSSDRYMQSIALKPGQQSIQQNNRFRIMEVDAEESVAWKNGYFQFKDEQVQSIMRKISRWYNVDVEYKRGVNKEQPFSGTISRYDHVSKVLEKLELTGSVHFQIEGRRIVVLK